MTLKYGLTLSTLLHICLFTTLLTISLEEGGRGLNEKPIFVRLANDIDMSVIRPKVGSEEVRKIGSVGVFIRKGMFHNLTADLPNIHTNLAIENTRPGNEVLIPNSDGLTIQGGQSQSPSSGDDRLRINTSSIDVSGNSIGDNGFKGEKVFVRAGEDSSGEIIMGSTTPDTIELIRGLIEKAKRYPALARKRGIEGTVHVSFRIDNDGKPYDIRVINSSGFSILDNATIEIIKEAGQFPYTDKVIELPISFRLNEG